VLLQVFGRSAPLGSIAGLRELLELLEIFIRGLFITLCHAAQDAVARELRRVGRTARLLVTVSDNSHRSSLEFNWTAAVDMRPRVSHVIYDPLNTGASEQQ
jgi:hypothetical protein